MFIFKLVKTATLTDKRVFICLQYLTAVHKAVKVQEKCLRSISKKDLLKKIMKMGNGP